MVSIQRWYHIWSLHQALAKWPCTIKLNCLVSNSSSEVLGLNFLSLQNLGGALRRQQRLSRSGRTVSLAKVGTLFTFNEFQKMKLLHVGCKKWWTYYIIICLFKLIHCVQTMCHHLFCFVFWVFGGVSPHIKGHCLLSFPHLILQELSVFLLLLLVALFSQDYAPLSRLVLPPPPPPRKCPINRRLEEL